MIFPALWLSLRVQLCWLSVVCLLFGIRCTIYRVQCWVYGVQCSVFSDRGSVFSDRCTVSGVQWSVFSVRCLFLKLALGYLLWSDPPQLLLPGLLLLLLTWFCLQFTMLFFPFRFVLLFHAIFYSNTFRSFQFFFIVPYFKFSTASGLFLIFFSWLVFSLLFSAVSSSPCYLLFDPCIL